jgi:adenylosuccinate synthase
MLQHAVEVTGGKKVVLALTKVDVLDTAEKIALCDEYRYDGDNYQVGGDVLKRGQIVYRPILDEAVLRKCTPRYTELCGWQTPLGGLTEADQLPTELIELIDYIDGETGAKVAIVSVGPDRQQKILMPD